MPIHGKKTQEPRSQPDDLARDVQRLSRLLTRDRQDLSSGYLEDPGLRRAYVGYFLPANIRKVLTPLRELDLHPEGRLAQDRLRVLDIGSGPGTALLGVLEFFADRRKTPHLELTAVDHVSANLAAAESLVRERADTLGINVSLRTVRSGIAQMESALRGPYDLIILSNVLNELFSEDAKASAKRAGLVAAIMDQFLDIAGSCIIIEPALRGTSRDLLQVRDGLLAAGCQVYAPCLVRTPCPALHDPKDWCHEERPWDPPPIIQEIDKLTGLRKDALKFSYLVLRKDRLWLRDAAGGQAVRVVSEPLVTKGKREYFCCGPEGRRLVVRLDKDAAPANMPFEELQRGDIVRFEGLLDEEKRSRVVKGTMVVPVIVLQEAGKAP